MKKFLSLLGTIGIVSTSVSTVISCVNKNPVLTKTEVNKKILAILDRGTLNWTGNSYGNAEIHSWIKDTHSIGGARRTMVDTTWLSIKMTSIFLDELLNQIPNLYKIFPNFILVVNTYRLGDFQGTENETITRVNSSFWQGNTVGAKKEIGIRANVGWSFNNPNSLEFINSMINKEMIYQKHHGGQWIQDENNVWILVPHTKESVINLMEERSLMDTLDFHPYELFEYFVDSIDNSLWSTNPKWKPNPKEHYARKKFAINFKFNQTHNRQEQLQNFVNDLKNVKTLIYNSDFFFNDIFNEYFFYLNLSSNNPKNLSLKLLDYPDKNYLKILFNNQIEFNQYKAKVIQEYKSKLVTNFFLNDSNFNNKRLFDDIEIDFKTKKYFTPQEFNPQTEEGKINRIIFGNVDNEKITENSFTSWNTAETGMLMIQVDINFIQKDENGNIIASLPYSFNLPVYARYN